MNSLVNTIQTVLSAASILSLLAAVLNGKRKDGYNQILRDSNAELRAQGDDKEKQIRELTGRAEAAEATAKQAVSMAQSRPAFEQLGVQMMEQHKELLGAIVKQTDQLTNIVTIVSKERS